MMVGSEFDPRVQVSTSLFCTYILAAVVFAAVAAALAQPTPVSTGGEWGTGGG